MPTISLTTPTALTVITAGLHATNYNALQGLLNGGLDNSNLAAAAGIDVTKLSAPGGTTTFLRADKTWASPGAGYGTSLPASPTDGQEFILVDSITNPTYQWRFRYNAGSSSSFKWEFVGGAPKMVEAANFDATTSTTYVQIANGPSYTIPKAGDWLVEARMNVSASDSTGSAMSYSIGANAANDAWSTGEAISSTGFGGGGSGWRRWDSLSASTSVIAHYRVQNGQSSTFFYRSLAFLPVRVS